MCGIAAVVDGSRQVHGVPEMLSLQAHRGPDASGLYVDPAGVACLGHRRLSIIDLSEAGEQPMSDDAGRYWISFNGEIYNFPELRAELSGYRFRTRTDTEVVIAAYAEWGEACLDRFIGMFAFVLWDEKEKRLFAARDRFGVKPLYYHAASDGRLSIASEIKALHAAGVPATGDEKSWATYLAYGLSDHSERTFWTGISALPPGHILAWHKGTSTIRCWYDLADRVPADFDARSLEEVEDEYLGLLEDSVRLRFRSDVPVGINLSGGVDSSALLALVQRVQGDDGRVKAFTFATGDPAYDELPWVRQMLAQTDHPSIVAELKADDVPELAAVVHACQSEPFGGVPTLAYAALFRRARAEGTTVLLDGQGMDEQWAGYDYYRSAGLGEPAAIVQGSTSSPVQPQCLAADFRELAEPLCAPEPFPDRLRNLQYRDIRYTKLPRALRFNDRVSMRSSTELREPFLDHRLVELALAQPSDRKIASGASKWMLRRMLARLLPDGVVEAPKRALQTPQREWLRGELRGWADEVIERGLDRHPGWFAVDRVEREWRRYLNGEGDNSFFVWQWIGLGLTEQSHIEVPV